jgi:hypothetical protein
MMAQPGCSTFARGGLRIGAMARHLTSVFLALGCLLAPVPAGAIEPTSVARHIEPSMVQILVEGGGRHVGGSGFVVSAEGHIATAYHVIQPHLDAGWEVLVVESGAAAGVRRSAQVVGSFPRRISQFSRSKA